MPLRMWTLGLAREQAPTRDHLYQYAALSLEAGYDALGVYLGHRFAYPSAPRAHGEGCLTEETVLMLRLEVPSLQIVPFANLLGHMEGFLNCEPGARYRKTHTGGIQRCPSFAEFRVFVLAL